MQAWQLLISSPSSGPQNMEIDLKLFRDFEKGLIPSTLRIYGWKPSCISLGYSQKIEEEIDLGKAKGLGWEVVKRPTGGGMVFHNEAEVTYSLVTAVDNPILPKGLISSYKRISEAVILGLTKIGVAAQIRNGSTRSEMQLCFSYPAEYEIVVDGKKIVGSAQKRGKKALLQQGAILVRKDGDDIFSALKKPQPIKGYAEKAISVEEILNRKISFAELSQAIVSGFERSLKIKLKDIR